jgi:hypothetical protein
LLASITANCATQTRDQQRAPKPLLKISHILRIFYNLFTPVSSQWYTGVLPPPAVVTPSAGPVHPPQSDLAPLPACLFTLAGSLAARVGAAVVPR